MFHIASLLAFASAVLVSHALHVIPEHARGGLAWKLHLEKHAKYVRWLTALGCDWVSTTVLAVLV
jgi:hypothetical protein